MTNAEFLDVCDQAFANVMASDQAPAVRKICRRLRLKPREYMLLALTDELHGYHASFGALRNHRQRVRRWRKAHRWRSPAGHRFLRPRWLVDRMPMPRRFGGRPWAVAFRVMYWRPQRGRRVNIVDEDPTPLAVYGVGRTGARAAKRIARSLAHDPSHVDQLPAGSVVTRHVCRVPGRSWWVVREVQPAD